MNGISCDSCGSGLLIHSDVRYIVRIDVRAAYDPVEIPPEDLERDLSREIDDLIRRLEQADPRTVQDQVHRAFRFDLCPPCQALYLRDPLGSSLRGRQGPDA